MKCKIFKKDTKEVVAVVDIFNRLVETWNGYSVEFDDGLDAFMQCNKCKCKCNKCNCKHIN